MSDEQTRSMTSAGGDAPTEDRADITNSTDPDEQPTDRSNKGIWILIGLLGCLGLVAICTIIAGLAAFFYVSDEVADESNTTSIPDIAIQQNPTPTQEPTLAAEPTPTSEPSPTPQPTPTPEPTATPVPEPTPEPESTPEPTPEPDPDPGPAEPAIAFSDGTQIVGEDIHPGIYYANNVTGSCYWERLRGFSGEPDEIIANAFSHDRQIVLIDSTDAGFSSSSCGGWQRDDFPIREDPAADLSNGTYRIGDEVAPGAWRSEASDEDCYWARLSGFGGTADDIIANEYGGVDDVVHIYPHDVGFQSSYCAPWVRIGD
jgi:hypothetical protein